MSAFQVGRDILKSLLENTQLKEYVYNQTRGREGNMSSEDLKPEITDWVLDRIDPNRNLTKEEVELRWKFVTESIRTNISFSFPDSIAYLDERPSIKVFFYCIYIFVFIVGILGNALVCYVVIRNKNMQTVTNLFITNLALSDILLCTLSVPFTPLYLLTFKKWIFGKLLCHLLPYAQGVSVYISAFTLMSIAIDRFFVIIYPFKPRMEIKICFLIIACVWIAAGILTFPYGWFMTIDEFHKNINGTDTTEHYCQEAWPRAESRTAFGFSTTILQFVIPFIIIAFCYVKVCCKLRERARCKPGAKSARKEELERERTRRTNRMLISMVLIFGASWLPVNIHNLIIDVYEPANDWPYTKAFFILAHAAAMSSTCYNPFLYAWLNDNFRKEFKQVLPFFKSSQKRSSSKSYQKRGNFRSNQSQLLNLKDRGIGELNQQHLNNDHECNGNHETIQLQDHNLVNNDDDDDQQIKNNNANFSNSLSNNIRNASRRTGSIIEEDEEQEQQEDQEDEDETEPLESDRTAIIPSSSTAPLGVSKKDASVYVRMESLSKKPPALTSREPSSTAKSEVSSSSPVRSSPRTKNIATMTSMSSKSASSVYVPETDSVKSKLTNNMAEDAL